MSLDSKRLLVLTAGPYQIPIMRRARALGLTVVATDRRPDAPGFAEADIVYCVDANNQEAVAAIAHRERIDGVLAEQNDIAVNTAAAVAARLGLPGIGVLAARRATNKRTMRDACSAAGITMPVYRSAATAPDARAAARFIGRPVVVKPVDSQGSRGVTKVDRDQDIDAAFARAARASRSGGVLVEEMLVGAEGSIEMFVATDAITVLGICDKVKSPPPFCVDLQLVYPGQFSPPIVEDIVSLARDVVAAIGLRDGLAHLEFIVTNCGVRLIEIAARGCGARVTTDLLPTLTGIDVLELRIRQALGEAVACPPAQTGRHGVLRFITLEPGLIESIADADVVRALEGVLLVEMRAACGDRIGTVENADTRSGFVMATGVSRSAVLASAEDAIRRLAIEVRLCRETSVA